MHLKLEFKISLFFTISHSDTGKIIITLDLQSLKLTETLFFELSTEMTVEENYRKIIDKCTSILF
jgi:hypothetical protein